MLFIGKKYSEEQISYILNSHKSSRELGEELNIPPTTIRSMRRRNGIDYSKKFSPNKEEFEQQVINFKGAIYKLAEYYQVNRATISNYAKKNGIIIGNHIHLEDEDIERIISLYYSRSASSVAKDYGVSSSYISKIWSTNGFKGKENRVYEINQNVFDDIDTEKKAYCLGFFAADGCIYKSKNHSKQTILRIAVNTKDEYILKLFQELLQTNKPIQHEGFYSALEISSTHIYEKFKEYGLDENKTYGNSICILGDEMMRHFIRGYIDGDGSIHISKNGKFYVTISGYEKNMNKIKQYLFNKNIFLSFIEDKRSTKENDRFGDLRTTNRTNSYAFLRYLYKDAHYFLSRKKEKADTILDKINKSDKIKDKEIITYYEYAVLDK